jgi:hypothetical protein
MIRTIILLDPIAPQVIPILIIPMMREMEDIKHIQIQAFVCLVVVMYCFLCIQFLLF